MTQPTSRRQHGLTLLEFTLITIVIGVLVAAALERIARTRVQMERAAVQHNVAQIRAVLALEFAELVVQGRLDEIPAYAGANALERVGAVENYTRVKVLPPESERQRGHWYFDASIGNLVYVPRYPDAISWPEGQPRLLRWQVRPDWNDPDEDGEFDRDSETVRGIDLVRLDDGQWR